MSKIEKSDIFRFVSPTNRAQISGQPHCFMLSYIQLVNYIHLQFKFLAQRGHTHLEGSKKAQKVKNVVEINENLPEVLKWHENKSAGQFRGENEIHELFSLSTGFSP